MLDSRAFLIGAVGRMRETAAVRFAFADRVPFHIAMQCRLAFAHWFVGEVAEADRVLGRAADLWPGHRNVWIFRFHVLAGTGRSERALAHVEDPVGRPPLPPLLLESFALSMRAALSGAADDRARAVASVTALISKSSGAVVIGIMNLNLVGAIDAAFEVAQAYFLERGPLIAALRWRPDGEVFLDERRRKTNMLFVPSTAPMRADPRFVPLVAEMGLDRYWRDRGVVPDFRRAGLG